LPLTQGSCPTSCSQPPPFHTRLPFHSTRLCLCLAPSSAMSPSLLDFPPEIFESIIRLLGLCDLFSLRLCSRTLATKSTSDHFKSYFHTKHIDITASSLGAFVKATQPGSLGCLIQHLVLVGVGNNTKQPESILEPDYSLEEETEEAERREEKQAKAQKTLKSSSSDRPIMSSCTNLKRISACSAKLSATSRQTARPESCSLCPFK
jgi:hypothetical protein